MAPRNRSEYACVPVHIPHRRHFQSEMDENEEPKIMKEKKWILESLKKLCQKNQSIAEWERNRLMLRKKKSMENYEVLISISKKSSKVCLFDIINADRLLDYLTRPLSDIYILMIHGIKFYSAYNESMDIWFDKQEHLHSQLTSLFHHKLTEEETFEMETLCERAWFKLFHVRKELSDWFRWPKLTDLMSCRNL